MIVKSRLSVTSSLLCKVRIFIAKQQSFFQPCLAQFMQHAYSGLIFPGINVPAAPNLSTARPNTEEGLRNCSI